MLAALLFCMANGYMQARSLCHLIGAVPVAL